MFAWRTLGRLFLQVLHNTSDQRVILAT